MIGSDDIMASSAVGCIALAAAQCSWMSIATAQSTIGWHFKAACDHLKYVQPSARLLYDPDSLVVQDEEVGEAMEMRRHACGVAWVARRQCEQG